MVKINSCRSEFFSLLVDPILEGLFCQGKQTGSHKLYCLCKFGGGRGGGDYEGVPVCPILKI